MFQIASLVLWSLDEYYYYAVCIFLISVFSICATILETQTVCGGRHLTSDTLIAELNADDEKVEGNLAL